MTTPPTRGASALHEDPRRVHDKVLIFGAAHLADDRYVLPGGDALVTVEPDLQRLTSVVDDLHGGGRCRNRFLLLAAGVPRRLAVVVAAAHLVTRRERGVDDRHDRS